MSSRRKAVLISAALLFLLGGGALGGAAFATQTAWGREQIRAYAQDFLNAKVPRGKWHLGRLGGSLFTEVTLDTFALREPNDSLFISSGPLRIRFSPRDLWDRRILVQSISLQHPVVHIRKDSLNKWNYNKVFPSGPPGPPRTTRRLGDYIAILNAEMRDGQFHLAQPWRPADSLRGARLDSAVNFALSRPDKMIRRSGSFFTQTRSWRELVAVIPWARIADPDTAGRFFDVTRLDAVGFDPPIAPRNARGTVRIVKDSLWADFPHFELPGSRGAANGKVVWGSDLPTRYDLSLRADTVSLSDVAWVYPTLPTTGGGSMGLRIRNERDLRVIDYILSDMDVRTVKSRLRGNMTFGVGGEVLVVKDVAMRAEPIDWDLIEDLTGKPLPYPWKGSITATLAASGGPVNAWRIERGDFAIIDANVPGATARGRARGEIDMLFPAFTKFHGLEVELDHFDLATMQFLNPLFPRLDGSISGRATLDSVWTDVRFRNGDITHHFGDEPKSRFTGSGRVTLGEAFLTYDVAMSAEPIELNTIAKAWPELLLEYRGTLTGPVRLQGTAEDLAVAASLTGGPGAFTWDGRVDIDSVGGYGYHGTLQFTNGNLRALYDTAAYPVTSLNGTAVVDIAGGSLLNYRGPVSVDLSRSWIDSTRVYDGARLRLRLMDGLVKVDSLWMETGAGTLVARGGLGLRPEQRDSLVVDVRADSLGGARPYLRRLATDSVAAALVDADSLLGLVDGRLTLAGSIDTLSVRGTIDARDLQAYASTAARARVQLDLGEVTADRMRGRASVTGDSLRIGTVRFANAALDADVHQADSAGLHLMAESTTGQTVDARGTWHLRADTSTLALSQARLGFEDHEWRLARPGVIQWSGAAFAVDSVLLRGSRGGSFLVHGDARDSMAVSLQARGDSLALEDLAALGQATVPIAGALSFDARFAGARENPNLTLTGRLTSTKVGQVTLSETAVRGQASNQRFVGGLTILRGDTAVLDVSANLPVDLALAPRSVRLLDDTLRVSAISRDLDLRLIESFTPALSNARGRLNTNMSVAGRRGRETLEGFLRVDSAAVFANELGVGLRGIEIDLRAARDTLRFERFRILSGGGARNALSLRGYIAINRWEDPAFDLALDATEFHAIDRRRTGDLTVSAGLRFSGRESASQLTGSITVNNGYVAIPVLSTKEIISLNDPAFASIIDTTLEANRRILPRLPRLLQGIEARQVSITMGPDVWLRSPEANIKLGGSVNVIRATGLATSGTPQLAVDGSLRTERGTFNVKFGDLLQRNFTVEGGEIRFFGDADFNPTLNISTLYTVRQRSSLYSDRSIRIRARLAGTLVQPRLDFESADSLQVSASDLISYLISGRPTSEIGGLDRYYVRDLLFTNLGAALSARFSGQYFDYVQLQSLAGTDVSATSSNNLIADLGIGGLAGTTVGAGKQLTDRIFVSLTTGLCPLQTFVSQASNNTNLADLVGGSLEVTIRWGLGVSVNREPPLAAVLCTQQTNGFAANRGSQLSVDLFRSWRW
jgi:translocation and assembly module TamB